MAPKASPKPKQTRSSWVDERKTYIGASEIAAVCGIHKYDTPRKVWMVKKGLMEVPDSLPMKIGRLLEDMVAKEFADYLGIRITALRRSGLCRHEKYPFLACNPDRVWKSPEGLAVVELKTADRYASGDFGPSGTDEVPDSYLMQVGWQMFICKAAVGYLAVVIGNSDFRVFKFTWTPTMKAIVARAAEEGLSFWQEYMEGDDIPPLSGLDADRSIVTGAYSDPTEEFRQSTGDLEQEIEGWPELCADFDRIKKEIARRENVLREFIGNTTGVHTTKGTATWKADKNGKRVLRYAWKKETA
jgi:putative phage-type endonuclease